MQVLSIDNAMEGLGDASSLEYWGLSTKSPRSIETNSSNERNFALEHHADVASSRIPAKFDGENLLVQDDALRRPITVAGRTACEEKIARDLDEPPKTRCSSPWIT